MFPLLEAAWGHSHYRVGPARPSGLVPHLWTLELNKVFAEPSSGRKQVGTEYVVHKNRSPRLSALQNAVHRDRLQCQMILV
jgi:hypothetical protein